MKKVPLGSTPVGVAVEVAVTIVGFIITCWMKKK
jgi:hypothetical protein